MRAFLEHLKEVGPLEELIRRLVNIGYDVRRMGHIAVALGGAAPLCVAIPYDWPMMLLRRAARRAASTWRPGGRLRALVRRASDMAVLGEAVIEGDLTVSSLEAPVREWALADLHTPLGIRPWEPLAQVVESLRPTAVALLAPFTDPYSLRSSAELPGFVLLHQECGVEVPWGLWGGPRLPVKYLDDPLPCSSPAEGEPRRALEVLRALEGRGC